MTFIEKQSQLHRDANTILVSIQVKLEILNEIGDNKPFYREKISKELDTLYLKYNDILRTLFEQVIPQEKYIGTVVNVVTIAEQFY